MYALGADGMYALAASLQGMHCTSVPSTNYMMAPCYSFRKQYYDVAFCLSLILGLESALELKAIQLKELYSLYS